jgi:hypothetical protein
MSQTGPGKPGPYKVLGKEKGRSGFAGTAFFLRVQVFG